MTTEEMDLPPCRTRHSFPCRFSYRHTCRCTAFCKGDGIWGRIESKDLCEQEPLRRRLLVPGAQTASRTR
jgi:hypothetical protein